ncbi:hypothetical protein Mgra_00009771, partial [Meloidogyne graminicola]
FFSVFSFLLYHINIYLQYNLIDNLSINSITIGNMMGHIIIIERTIATLNSFKYEKQKGYLFTILWIFILVIIIILMQLTPSILVEQKFNFFSLITHLTLALSIGELIVFSILNLKNKKRYEQFNDIKNNYYKYKLTERYQLQENIYSGKQLIPTFIFHLINILCSNIVCIIIDYLNINSGNGFELLICFMFFTHTISKLGIEVTVIT